ncbi:MAG TPA: hypothetical protein VF576_07000 [Rubricoccaceae bacterium]
MRPLALAVLAGAAHAQPSSPDGPAAFVSVSYLESDGFYGFTGGLDADVLTLRLGAEAPVLRRPGLPGRLGPALTVGLALQAADFSAVPFRSGLRAQSAELYGRVSRPLGRADVAATAGFVLDVGPEFEDDDGVADDPDTPFPNSDMRDAIRLGVAVAVPAGRTRLSGSVEGVRLFPVTYVVLSGSGVPGVPDVPLELATVGGHYLNGHVGFAVPLPDRFEAGLRVVAVRRTEEREEATDCEGDCTNNTVGPRYVVGLVPHIGLSRPGSPVSFTLAGEAPAGFFGEHGRYGFGLVGSGEPKARLPVTFSARYAL